MIVGLVREVIEITGGFQNQCHTANSRIHIHTVHGRGEICHIETTHEALGNSGVNKLHVNFAAFAEHVNIHLRVRQFQSELALSVARALKL